MPGIKMNPNGGMGVQGSDLDDGGCIPVSFTWVPTSTDCTFFVAKRRYIISDISYRIDVAGTDASAVTATIKRVVNTGSISSGTALHSSTINLKGTASTHGTLTLAAADTIDLPALHGIAIDFSGTLTSAVGCVTVTLLPA